MKMLKKERALGLEEKKDELQMEEWKMDGWMTEGWRRTSRCKNSTSP